MRVDKSSLHYNLGRFLRLRMRMARHSVYTLALNLGVRPELVLNVISGLRMPRFADLDMVCSGLKYDTGDALRCAWVLSDSQSALGDK